MRRWGWVDASLVETVVVRARLVGGTARVAGRLQGARPDDSGEGLPVTLDHEQVGYGDPLLLLWQAVEDVPDGTDHKAWVIDQVAWYLLGSNGYGKWVDQMTSGENEGHDWDTGIAP